MHFLAHFPRFSPFLFPMRFFLKDRFLSWRQKAHIFGFVHILAKGIPHNWVHRTVSFMVWGSFVPKRLLDNRLFCDRMVGCCNVWMQMAKWTCSATPLVASQVLQNTEYFADFSGSCSETEVSEQLYWRNVRWANEISK